MKRLLVMGFISLFAAGCSKQDSEISVSKRPVVYTVNYPLCYFAERIAGDRVEVVLPEIEGDPAFWTPAMEEIGKFQNADLILINGAGYAKWIPTVALPQSRLIDTSVAFKESYIELDDSVTHTHGPGGAHAHGDLAFTTWLDTRLALQQAKAVYEAFSGQWEEHNSSFEANFRSLEKDLLELDARLETAFIKLNRQPLLGSHPVYQYLARRYALNLASVHWEPDEMPDEKNWAELRKILEKHPARLMLWEDEPLAETKAALEKMGIKSIVFSPCGNQPHTGDYLSVMKSNLLML